MVASASCNHPDRAASIKRVVEIDLLNQLADIAFGNSESCLSVERESPRSHEILSKAFKNIRSLSGRQVLPFVIWIRKEKLCTLVMRDIELVG